MSPWTYSLGFRRVMAARRRPSGAICNTAPARIVCHNPSRSKYMHKCLSRSKDWQEGQGEIVHVAPDHTHREQERRDRCAAPATGVEVIEALVANVTATARPQLIRSQF